MLWIICTIEHPLIIQLSRSFFTTPLKYCKGFDGSIREHRATTEYCIGDMKKNYRS